MNRIAIIISLVLVLLMVRGQAFVWYALNYEYIAEELCLNPETKCNGFCQLAEQVSKDVPQDESRIPFLHIEEVNWASESVCRLPELPGYNEISKRYSVLAEGQELNPMLHRLFRPPRKS